MNSMTQPPKLGIIVPCFNEEEVLQHSSVELFANLERMVQKGLVDKESFICFVDDGSRDRTWEMIENLRKNLAIVKGVKLSANCGHQNALFAGLLSCSDKVDCLLTIDADLQDDMSIIDSMIEKLANGAEIVYGVKKKRLGDSFLKNLTAFGFYRLMQFMGVNIVFNHADFRLISRRVAIELEHFSEVNLFLRGIFPFMGFRTDFVYYDLRERRAGASKYPLHKMIAFALDGITSFSIQPLRLVSIAGFLIFILSICFSIYALMAYFFFDVVHGWASIVLPIYFIGGIQLLSIGILGEYLGKIYKEVKRRPRYIIEKKI